MTTKHDVMESTDEADEAISRALRSLCGYHKLRRNDLAVVFPQSEATLFRRFRVGGWTAGEVRSLAQAFSVPSGDLLEGRVDINSSAWLAGSPTPFDAARSGPSQGAPITDGVDFSSSSPFRLLLSA